PKLFSARVVAEGFDGKWEFKPLSLWQREFGIFKYGLQMPIAKYVSNFWRTKGTVELPKGARLQSKSERLKKPLEIFSLNGELLMSYDNKFSLKGRTTVTIEDRSELFDKHPWIIMLGWYIVFLNKRRRAHVAG
ncbi:MAG TPA: hypothetical protein VIY47_07705, partial [Ignavibacteriaceae bacterium]